MPERFWPKLKKGVSSLKTPGAESDLLVQRESVAGTCSQLISLRRNWGSVLHSISRMRKPRIDKIAKKKIWMICAGAVHA